MPRGRPKGSKNKGNVAVMDVPRETIKPKVVNKAVEVSSAKIQKEEVKEKKIDVLAGLEPLGAGQAYFEAPDGTVLIGDETRAQIWYRAGNGGNGIWINKKRG